MIYTSLELPPWLRHGIRPTSKGQEPRKFIYGADTETAPDGSPITFQFYSEHAARNEIIWLDGKPEKATRAFLGWCRSLIPRALHVVYGHNLVFDLISFLWDNQRHLVETQSGEFAFALDGWVLSGVYGAPTFMHVRNESTKHHIILADSFSYYRASLDAASEVFCPHLRKLAKPDGLGEKIFYRGDTEFIAYAMRDAEIAYWIGIALEKLHEEFNLPQTVSVANMAAKIFQHEYLRHPIPYPRAEIMQTALSSYHGGKNNITAPPGFYPHVYSLDISSAYPDAMASFPSFYEPTLYKAYRATAPRQVPDLGVYRVWGYVKPDPWPVLFAHDFSPYGRTGRSERLEGIAVTGYELNEAIRSGEFTPTRVSGWLYEAERDGNDAPLAEYVSDFYARKEAATDKGMRAMYKFLLNSISGKFIQTRKANRTPHFDLSTNKLAGTADLVGGGMFHPFIGSLITGHTRAKMHRLEHKYKALHTATDGIFTENDLSGEDLSGKGLGVLTNEAEGELLLLRNKLYVLYGEGAYSGVKGTTPSINHPDKHIIKYALHGFGGRIADLENMVASGSREYTVRKANRLRVALKTGENANAFRDYKFTLKNLPDGELPVHKQAPLSDNVNVSTAVNKRRA